MKAALRVALIGGCVAIALWGIDFGLLWGTLRQYDPVRLLMIVGFSITGYIILGLRLRMLVSDPQVPGRAFLHASVLALGVNNVLPARLGEFAKAAYLAGRSKRSTAALLAAVFWERFLDLHALLFLVALWFLMNGDAGPVAPLALGIAGLWALIFTARNQRDRLQRWIDRLPGKKLAAIGSDILSHINRGIARDAIGPLVAFTMILWAIYAIQLSLVLVWVAGLPIGFEAVLVAFVLSTAGMVLPLSPGSIGVYEALVVLALSWYGVERESALAAAFAAHMLQYVPTTIWALTITATSKLSLLSSRSPTTAPS
ncbi:MAG: flippase-like domain-containing protein [Gammaproteobacteria bacterium]|nr:flippase-like domain-containing protein [Gammaproteobacteria bacterium]